MYVIVELCRLGYTVADERSLVGICLAIALDGGLLIALVKRHRWAWVACVILQLFAVVLLAGENDLTVTRGVVDVVQILLLLSPQMRRYINKLSDVPVLSG